MKRPAFQFYPADWRNNAKLRRCSFAERGIWLETMCLLHDSEEYGILRWPLKDVAQAVGCRLPDLRAIATKDVLKGADSGFQGFTYTPRHAGKDGEPVTLIPATDGPVWFSSRMVVDEYVRGRRGSNTHFSPDYQPNKVPKPTPKPTNGDGKGYGPTSSSTERSKEAASPPDPLWGEGLQVLTKANIPIESARTFLGKCLKDWPADTVLDALREARGTADPRGYATKLLQAKPKKNGRDSDYTRGAV